MVLAFTEKQKKEIEARGMTVIEFKRRIRSIERSIGKCIDDVWQILKEAVDIIIEAWNIFKEKIIEAVDDAKLVFEQICEAYHYPTSRRYRIVKIFSKCKGTDVRFWWNLTFRLKRWLARSCC